MNEIKAYAGLKESFYFLGPKTCPATWSLKSITKEEAKNLPRDKKSEIVSLKEDKNIEKILSDNFLGYNKFVAGEGEKKFVIYETICKVCEIK